MIGGDLKVVTFSQQTAAPSPVSTTAAATKSSKNGGGNKLLPLIVVVAVILAIGGGYWFFKGRGGGISSGEYQAVFLSNGQVYFGKIAKASSEEVVLKDIYYLITRPALQDQTPEASPAAQEQQSGYTLIKLGQEMHGPTDEMRINRKHILFIEGLREDGRVAQAIMEAQAQAQE